MTLKGSADIVVKRIFMYVSVLNETGENYKSNKGVTEQYGALFFKAECLIYAYIYYLHCNS